MPTLRPRKRQSEAPTATRSEGVITTSASAVPLPPNFDQRGPGSAEVAKQTNTMSLTDEERPLLDGPTAENAEVSPTCSSWTKRNQWIVFALASGACAAFNGVFAKL
jgi:hypothetical protein